MPDACPFGCTGELGPETRSCIETRQRQCARCGAVACQRDECPHASQVLRLRAALEAFAARPCDRARDGTHRAACTACAARAALRQSAPARAEGT